MIRFTAVFFAIAIIAGTVRDAPADENTRVCALTKAIECTSDEGCMEVTMEEMALPRFVRIDLKAGTITSLDRTVRREPTKISTIDRREGMLVLHGTEKRGWSMALMEEFGTLTISASGDGEGFVVFGACMKP